MTIASIDIGTNTVLLLIARIDLFNNQMIPIVNEYRMPRIGFGIKQSGIISNDRRSLLYNVLSEYKDLIDRYKCEKILVTGTNAFRIAKNADEIVIDVKKNFNFHLNVISGEEEAEFAFLGAISNIDKPDNCTVIDIGGSSTEIITGYGNEITSKKSLQLGSVSTTEQFFKHSPPLQSETENFRSELTKLFSTLGFTLSTQNVVAIAGTATTLACVKLGLPAFNEKDIIESKLTISDMKNIVNKFSLLSSSEIMDKYGPVMNGREDIIFAGAYILFQFMESFGIEEIKVSTRGIRYGAIVNYIRQGFLR